MKRKNPILFITILIFLLVVQFAFSTYIVQGETFTPPYLSGVGAKDKKKQGIPHLAQIYDLNSSVSVYNGELSQSIDTGTLYGAQLGASTSGVIATHKWSPKASGEYAFEFVLDIDGKSKLTRFTYLQGAWIASSIKMVFQITNINSGEVVASDSLNRDSRVLPTKTTLMLDLAGKSAGLVHAALSSKVSTLASQHPDKKIYALSKARYALVSNVSDGSDFFSIIESLFEHSKDLNWDGTFLMTDVSLQADQKYQIECFLRSTAVHNAIIESSTFVDTEIDAKIKKIDVTQGEVSNYPPKAQAGSKVTAKKGTEIKLNGNNSTDPDGDKLNYHWEGPGLNEDSAVAKFTPPFTGTKEYTLTVDDGQLQDTTSVKVTVQPRIPPNTSLTDKPNKVVNKNSVTFQWEATDDLTDSSEMVYSYKLEGFDYAWSPWSKETKEVYDLTNGEYTFRVKAKDEVGNEETDPASYTFNVELPGSLKVDVSNIDGTRFESGVLNQKVSMTNKGQVELKDVKVSPGGEISDWMQIISSESDWDSSTNTFPSIPYKRWKDDDRSFQLNVSIPEDVSSGNYEGEIVISTKTPNTSKVKIPVSIEILEKGKGTAEDERGLSDEDSWNWDVYGKHWKKDGTWGRVWKDSFNMDSEEFDNLQSAKLHFKYKGMSQEEAEDDPMVVYFNGEKIGELPTTNDWREHTLNLSLDNILKQDNKVKVKIKKEAEDSYSIYNLSEYSTEFVYVYLEPGDTDLDIANDKVSVNKGETFTVSGTVYNDGGKEATSTEISIDYDSDLFEKIKGQKARDVGKLNPAESFSYEWTFKALKQGKHELIVECSSDQDEKDDSYITVNVWDNSPPEITVDRPGWSMVAPPVEPAKGRPENVFGKMNNPNQIYRWDPGANNGEGGFLTPDKGFKEVNALEGIWLLLEENEVPKTFPIKGVYKESREITLQEPGWHQVGVPKNYAWANIGVKQGNSRTMTVAKQAGGPSAPHWMSRFLWEYDPETENTYTAYDASTSGYTMEQGDGYWVRTREENVTLVIPYDSPNSTTSKVSRVKGIPMNSEKAEKLNIPNPPAPPITYAVEEFSIQATPNPVTNNDRVTFIAAGSDVQSFQVKVYGSSGKQIHASPRQSDHTYTWKPQTSLSNGLYLYQVTAQKNSGQTMTETGKLLVLQ